MGKIFCTECGAEMNETMNFCSNCGTPLDNNNDNSNEIKEDQINSSNEHSVKINPKTDKTSKSKYSNTTKVFLGIAGICILIAILGVVLIGSSMMSSTDNTYSEDTSSETLSPSFTDTIYGIDFQIPEGYETLDGTDNKNMGTSTTYDRSYMGNDGGLIRISVSTTEGNFYWDLSQNRAYDDVDETINGHEGVLDSGGGFKYVTDDGKLVMIDGASEDQLESIIIE